jgi:hypothetical protein
LIFQHTEHSHYRILKWEFSNVAEDDWGLNGSRGAACEFVAWQFLCHLNQRETIEFLLEELPSPRRRSTNLSEVETGISRLTRGSTESTPLLSGASTPGRQSELGKQNPENQSRRAFLRTQTEYADDCNLSRYSRFFGLNALEVAAVASAKRFLSQRVVQRVVNDIWNGEIVFWDSLTVHSIKKPQIFNRK